MGMASWSPRLDAIGNSQRSITFFSKFVSTHAVHMFSTIPGAAKSLYDPKLLNGNHKNERVAEALFAAASGDVRQIASLIGLGVGVNDSDYDLRTPLHVACAEQHTKIVEFLLSRGADPLCVDRWGRTSIDDAREADNERIVKMLEYSVRRRKRSASKRTSLMREDETVASRSASNQSPAISISISAAARTDTGGGH
jgi:ankyrin repeat protein